MAPLHPHHIQRPSGVDHGIPDGGCDARSPADGCLHASASPEPQPRRHGDLGRGQGRDRDQDLPAAAARVPLVPGALVDDFALREQGAKGRESGAQGPVTKTGHQTTPGRGLASSLRGRSASPAASHHRQRGLVDDEAASTPGQHTHLPSSDAPSRAATRTLPRRHGQMNPPPACSPSPPGGQYQGYQTFASLFAHARRGNDDSSRIGIPDESQTLLLRHPQSMADGPDDSPPSRWQSLKKSMGWPNWRRRPRTVLGMLVIFTTIVAVVIGAVSVSPLSHHRTSGSLDRDPVREPGMDGESDLEWKLGNGCRNTPHAFPKRTTSINFGAGRKLQVKQTIETGSRRSGRQPEVSGQLVVRPAGDERPQGTIELDVISNDEALRVETEANLGGHDQTFKVATTQSLPWWPLSGGGPCVQMRLTIWVPQGSFLQALSLTSVHLDVSIMDGLVLGVDHVAKISTVVGDLKTSVLKDADTDLVPYTLDSPSIYIETVSGDVEGWFPLYDVLDITSASGNIIAQVGPKPADRDSPKPAVLQVESVSGHVGVTEPLTAAIAAGMPSKRLPARDYVVKLSTSSGDMSAEAAIGTKASFSCISGNLDLKLLPVLAKPGSKPRLSTNTENGDARLTVLEPLWTSRSEARSSKDDGDATRPGLSGLQSRHRSVSGSTALVYPASWVGRFDLQTLSGDLAVRGDGVEVDRRSRGIVMKLLEGHKGQGASEARVESISGDVGLVVGKADNARADALLAPATTPL